jgi:hypothetical protein
MADAAGNEHSVDEVFEDLAEWRQVLADAKQRFVYPEPEKRLAEQLSRKFNGNHGNLRQSADNIAANLAALVTAIKSRNEDE